jgi:hypothetical protein
MIRLEPSYLRYIYDGLEKGDLHPDNAAALPEGLTGLYDAAFEDNKPARERQKLLETFAIWALLKKEVSAQFVAEIIEVPTQKIVDFIATYSSWFTSPESGKYQLYHERLKVYLLQKLSEQEIDKLLEKIVFKLEQALTEQKQDEFELYGLEFLSVHYFTTAMIIGDGTKLIALSYDQNHWQRQLKLSKGFEWTKKGLKQVMTWASKFNDDEVIECGLKMVDLNHQEQNDAPQIVALVADGDIEAALKRIEDFGGNDKEDLQRKFILIVLCLLELSESNNFNKLSIQKYNLLFDFFKQLFINKKIEDFILDIFPKSKYNALKKIFNINEYECSQILKEFKLNFNNNDLIFFEITNVFTNGEQENNDLKLIQSSALHCKNGNLLQGLKLSKKVKDDMLKISLMLDIAIEYFKINDIKKVNQIIIKSLNISNTKIEQVEKSYCLSDIVNVIAKINSKSINLKFNLFDIIESIGDKEIKKLTINNCIQIHFASNNYFELKKILSYYLKFSNNSHFELENFTEIILSLKLNQAIFFINNYYYNDSLDKSIAIRKLAIKLLNDNFENEVHNIVNYISYEHEKVTVLSAMLINYLKNDKIDLFKKTFAEALRIANIIDDDYWQEKAYYELFIELSKLYNYKKIKKLIFEIPSDYSKILILLETASIYIKKNSKTYFEIINLCQDITNEFPLNVYKQELISRILSNLAKNGQIDKAINLKTERTVLDNLYYFSTIHFYIKGDEIYKLHLNNIQNEEIKNKAIAVFAEELANKNKLYESIVMFDSINNVIFKNKFIQYITEIWLTKFGISKTLIYCNRYLNKISLLELKNIVFEHVFCYVKDFNSLKAVLNIENSKIKFALEIFFINRLFHENLTNETLIRVNQTLNIQWAIDIKNQLPN